MIINPNSEESYNLTQKNSKPVKIRDFSENYFRFSPKLIIISMVLTLFGLLGNWHIGYGNDGFIFHRINSDDSLEQSAKILDGYTNNSENSEKEKKEPLDYEVKRGDTLWDIAGKYNIGINAILQANDLTAKSVIKPGQKLKLPFNDKIPADSNLSQRDFQIRAVLNNEDSAGSQANSLEDNDPNERKPFDYEIESGDTISNIAERYNLKINTILWANDLTAKSVIKPGQKLVLLPVDGVLHKIKKGEIIGEIALLHKADVQKTIDYNNISDTTKIYPGDLIIIPDGQPLPPPPPKPRISKVSGPSENTGNNPQDADKPALNSADKLLWPTSTKRITQGYRAKHRGIDIANGGTPPIFASHDGIVEFADRSGNWGNTVLLRRSDGLLTRYSHASEIYVTVGQPVNKGDTIAKIGTTGRSTGNHLDFRVYINGVAANPLKLLQEK